MNIRILLRVIIALVLLIAAGAGVYLVMKFSNKEKLQPVLERYQSSDDPTELREALLRTCRGGNSVAMLEFANWVIGHKPQFFQVTDGFSDLAQKKDFGKCFADALVDGNANYDFTHTFADGNTEVLNIIRADIVRAQTAKKK